MPGSRGSKGEYIHIDPVCAPAVCCSLYVKLGRRSCCLNTRIFPSATLGAHGVSGGCRASLCCCAVRGCLAPCEIGFKSLCFGLSTGKRQETQNKGECSQGRHYPSTQAQQIKCGLTYKRSIAPTDTKMHVTVTLQIPNQHALLSPACYF